MHSIIDPKRERHSQGKINTQRKTERELQPRERERGADRQTD